MNIKKTTTTAAIGLALCMFAPQAQAVGIGGACNYKLVLRDQYGFAMSYEDGGKVSEYYTFEVYNAAGQRINLNSTPADVTINSNVGHNCLLSVQVFSDAEHPQAGHAVPGEQLTLVVKSGGTEVFRSSKILPPVKWGSINSAPVGVFYADPTDTDGVYDQWLGLVNMYCDANNGDSLGGRDDDYDGDGLTNMREYQFGTDPAGGICEMVNTPDVSIVEEQDGVIKVSFNYGWNHVYSVRAIEGTETYGVDGEDLALYDSLANLNAGTSSGKYFYDGDWNSGTKTFYVRKPDINGVYLIGLAVDGRLLEYIRIAPAAYEITWKDDSGVTIDTTNVYAGDTPTHADPSKANEGVYSFQFTGWTPALEAAVSNTTYTATYRKVVDLSQLSGNYTAVDGDVLTNSTTYAVTIPGGASVTINGVAVQGAGGGAAATPEFSAGGEAVTTKFTKGDGNTWNITAWGEIANNASGTDVGNEQIKVYRGNEVDAVTTPVTPTALTKKSAVKVELSVEAPVEADKQFFKVEFE